MYIYIYNICILSQNFCVIYYILLLMRICYFNNSIHDYKIDELYMKYIYIYIYIYTVNSR